MCLYCDAGKPDIVVAEDEEYKRVNFDKFRKLSTVFQVSISCRDMNGKPWPS
jgi:hypothetical protein